MTSPEDCAYAPTCWHICLSCRGDTSHQNIVLRFCMHCRDLSRISQLNLLIWVVLHSPWPSPQNHHDWCFRRCFRHWNQQTRYWQVLRGLCFIFPFRTIECNYLPADHAEHTIVFSLSTIFNFFQSTKNSFYCDAWASQPNSQSLSHVWGGCFFINESSHVSVEGFS